MTPLNLTPYILSFITISALIRALIILFRKRREEERSVASLAVKEVVPRRVAKPRMKTKADKERERIANELDAHENDEAASKTKKELEMWKAQEEAKKEEEEQRLKSAVAWRRQVAEAAEDRKREKEEYKLIGERYRSRPDTVPKPLEKLKPNGTRGHLNRPPKVGHHSSSQPVNHGLRGAVRPDMPKLSQSGNSQIVKRGRNIIPSTAKYVSGVNSSTRSDGSTANRVVSSTSVVADVHPPQSGPMSPKRKSDGQSSYAVPELSSGKSTELNTGSISSSLEDNNYPASSSTINCSTEIGTGVNFSAGCEPTPAVPFSGPGKSGELTYNVQTASLKLSQFEFHVLMVMADLLRKVAGDPAPNTGSISSDLEDSNHPASNTSISYSTENGNGVGGGGLNACEVPENYVSESYPDPAIDPEKEAALLKLFGWEEDASEEALTPEEINTFLKKYEEHTTSLKLPQFKFHALMADLLRKNAGDRSGGGSSSCTAEADFTSS